jgi:prevent-host-death family protein
MVRAGTKLLKNRLSYYLRRVRRGESVEVTDRGVVVAELCPPRRQRKQRAEAALTQLEAEGALTRPVSARRRDFAPYKLLKPVNISDLVLEGRG